MRLSCHDGARVQERQRILQGYLQLEAQRFEQEAEDFQVGLEITLDQADRGMEEGHFIYRI